MTGSVSRGGRLYLRGLNWIGDAVLSLGAIQGLHKVRPDLEITVGVPKATADIYRLSPAVNHVHLLGMGKERARYDAAVLFPRSFRSAWESFFLSASRVGYASEGRSFLLTTRLDFQSFQKDHQHQSRYYERLLQEIDSSVLYEPPLLQLSENRRKWADEKRRALVPEGSPVVAINPGAFYGRAKTWPTHHFITLLKSLFIAMPFHHVILFSGKPDRPLAQAIIEGFPHQRLHSVAGELSLEESAALLSRCSILLTNDSGMMHVGGALGIPGLALFGPTDPIATGPLSPPSGKGMAVLSEPPSCAPCFLRECPIDHRCMERLTPARVLGELITLINERAQG